MRTANKDLESGNRPQGNRAPVVSLVLWVIAMMLVAVALIGRVVFGSDFWTSFFLPALAVLLGLLAVSFGRVRGFRQRQAVPERGRGGSVPEGVATVEVIVTYPPMAYLYAWSKPSIVIDGHLERRPWGFHTFELEPGDHHIEISYPYLFVRRCGANSVRLTLEPGETRRVHYTARSSRFVSGKISVE